MKRHHYILIAVCSYLFFVLASAPAASVIAFAKKNINLPVQFYGVQGSIWSGQASAVLAQAQRIDNLQWSVNPAALLLAKLSAEINADIKNLPIHGHVSININGSMHAEDVRASISAQQLQQLIAMPFGELAGNLDLHIESLDWTGTGLPRTTATLNWRDAKLTLADSVDLGKILVAISPDDKDGLLITISNTQGMISLDGNMQLGSNKQYTLSIDFKPATNATNSIKQSLAMFAQRQSNGSYRVKQNGNLKQLGL